MSNGKARGIKRWLTKETLTRGIFPWRNPKAKNKRDRQAVDECKKRRKIKKNKKEKEVQRKRIRSTLYRRRQSVEMKKLEI